MSELELNIEKIKEYQKNRNPYLFVDHANKVIPGKCANGYKFLSEKEWFFKVHWPGDPNMPGMLQIESLVQLSALALTTLPGNKGKVTHAISHNVRFRREIVPGEKLIIETKVLSWKRGLCKGLGKGIVSGEIACEAEMTITIPEILDKYIPKK